MQERLIGDICTAAGHCKNSSGKVEICGYEFSEQILKMKNQFLIMLKPEILDLRNGVDTPAILKKVFEKFDENEVKINGGYVISGSYLKRHKLIDKQYSILNRGAHSGLENTPSKYRKDIEYKYHDRKIMGAIKFLEANPDMSSSELEKISHRIGSEKIGNGTYLLRYEDRNGKYGIINAFHPYQLEHFYEDDSVIVTFDCSSNTDYKVLALDLIGFFNPQKAEKSSLRNYIFENKGDLGMEKVGTFLNGFHISPSPLEGMFATLRYCIGKNSKAVEINKTKFGIILLNKGFPKERIMKLALNPYVNLDGEINSLFDIAEGQNTEFIEKFIVDFYEEFDFNFVKVNN